MSFIKGVARADNYPDYFPYEDTGCGGACIHSLECPYPQCVHDAPRIRAQTERAVKRQECIRLRAEGRTSGEIARLVGISRRTAIRYVSQEA